MPDFGALSWWSSWEVSWTSWRDSVLGVPFGDVMDRQGVPAVLGWPCGGSASWHIKDPNLGTWGELCTGCTGRRPPSIPKLCLLVSKSYIHEIVTSWRNQFIFELNLPGRVRPRLLHRVAFMHRRLTYRCFYTQTLLHREAFAQTFFFHIDAFAHKNCLVQTEAFAHAQKTTVYTAYRKRSEFLHKRFFCTETLLHTATFAPRCLYTEKPVTPTQTSFCTQMFLHKEDFA